MLDLGSGSGRDCYLAAAMVGPTGSVTGVDMTQEQLDTATEHVEDFTNTMGYPKKNLRFVKVSCEIDDCEWIVQITDIPAVLSF